MPEIFIFNTWLPFALFGLKKSHRDEFGEPKKKLLFTGRKGPFTVPTFSF